VAAISPYSLISTSSFDVVMSEALVAADVVISENEVSSCFKHAVA
jgi:hypothetical protein